MREWLMSLPCVIDGRVRIDIRGAWPIAFIGMKSCKVDTRNAFVYFIIENLD